MDSTPMRILFTGLVFQAFELLADFRFEALFGVLIRFKLNGFDLPITMAIRKDAKYLSDGGPVPRGTWPRQSAKFTEIPQKYANMFY
jgi:hypothetical protein